MKVKSLPKGAKYDYIDVYGRKVYHTERRVYAVTEKNNFGRKCVTVQSFPKKLWIQL